MEMTKINLEFEISDPDPAISRALHMLVPGVHFHLFVESNACGKLAIILARADPWREKT